MDENTMKVINDLAATMGTTATHITEKYAGWFVWQSAAFIALGALICVFALAVIPSKDRDGDIDGEAILWKAAICFVGCLFIFCNVGDLLAPEGAAIHQIIQDIRSGE